MWQTFRLGLRELGWIEGQNLRIESRWAEDNYSRLPELTADLIRLRVDLIVTRGSTYVQGARKATSAIPIVFLVHADPVATGHVASLAKPGGNITGLSLLLTEIYRKGFEILISTVPAAKRIAVLYNPETPSHIPGLKTLEESARGLRLQLQPVVARAGAELESAFTAIARADAQALFVLSFGPYSAKRQRLAELAIRHRLPTMFADRVHVEAGGLMSYGADLGDLFRRGAILCGQNPQRREACRSPGRATHEVRAGDQRQDGEGPRSDDSPITSAASGSGDRPMNVSRVRTCLFLALVLLTAEASAQQASKVTSRLCRGQQRQPCVSMGRDGRAAARSGGRPGPSETRPHLRAHLD